MSNEQEGYIKRLNSKPMRRRIKNGIELYKRLHPELRRIPADVRFAIISLADVEELEMKRSFNL